MHTLHRSPLRHRSVALDNVIVAAASFSELEQTKKITIKLRFQRKYFVVFTVSFALAIPILICIQQSCLSAFFKPFVSYPID